MATRIGGVEAVDRAVRLLSALADADRPVALSELARRTGMHKTTALRLLSTLANRSMTARDDAGAWRLGPELWRLGSRYRRSHLPAALVRPLLRRLCETTGETASFYVRDDDVRVVLYRENSPSAARHHLEEGARLDLSGGAAALVLRAGGGEEGAEMDAVRAAGHAVSVGARDPELAAVAVPVRDAENGLLGALCVSGLIGRFDAAERAAALVLLKTVAADLERSSLAGTSH